jgi:hypothetical protein
MRLHCHTEHADGTKQLDQVVDVQAASVLGRVFADPTINEVVIRRTADGAILKGDKTTTYRRIT